MKKEINEGDILYEKKTREEYVVTSKRSIIEEKLCMEIPEDWIIKDKKPEEIRLSHSDLANPLTINFPTGTRIKTKSTDSISFSKNVEKDQRKESIYFALKSKYGKEIYQDYDYVVENFYTLSDMRENTIDSIL